MIKGAHNMYQQTWLQTFDEKFPNFCRFVELVVWFYVGDGFTKIVIKSTMDRYYVAVFNVIPVYTEIWE